MIDHLYYGDTASPMPPHRGGSPVSPSQPSMAAKPSPSQPSLAARNSVRGIVRIDPKVIEHHLRRIYERENPAGAWIESGMYRAVRDILESAVDEGTSSSQQAAVSPLPSSSPSPDLADALKRSADVFAAHKVHRIQQDMARLLVDDQGNLRNFREWRELVTPIAAHQVGPWLQTEYSTAVLRAQQAVEWQQFEAEADVLPNLRWVPSTAVHPGADHQVFWNTILPIHHPFWDQHRPGDRWNCHCSLEATDEHPTAPPKGFELRGNGPQPGLNENPGKTGRLFAQSHPYFPQTCAQCAFYQGGIASGFKNQEKDCQNCPFIQGCINATRPIDGLLAMYDGKTKTYKGEEWCIDIESANGNLMIAKKRIEQAKKGKTEMEKFLKEREMSRVIARNGHNVEYREESQVHGDTFDIFIDGIPADLKKLTSGAGDLHKHCRKAFKDQGAKIVVFSLPERNEDYSKALSSAYNKYHHLGQIWVYYQDESIEKYHNKKETT